MAANSEDARWLNPSACWCYPGEHFVGNHTKLAEACLSGLPPHMVPSIQWPRNTRWENTWSVCRALDMSKRKGSAFNGTCKGPIEPKMFT